MSLDASIHPRHCGSLHGRCTHTSVGHPHNTTMGRKDHLPGGRGYSYLCRPYPPSVRSANPGEYLSLHLGCGVPLCKHYIHFPIKLCVRSETIVHTFDLLPRSRTEIHTDINTSRTKQCGVEELGMVSCHDDNRPIRSSDAVHAIQQAAQGYPFTLRFWAVAVPVLCLGFLRAVGNHIVYILHQEHRTSRQQ